MKNSNYISYKPYLRNSIAYDHDFWYTCIKCCCFHFFKILIFGVVSGVEGGKMAQNDKKICLSRFISQESYIIWLSIMVHLREMMMSPVVVFFIFSEFWFSGLLGGKRAKSDPKLEKILSARFHTSRTIHIIIICGFPM